MLFPTTFKINSLLPYASTFSVPEYVSQGMHWLMIALYTLNKTVSMDARRGAVIYQYCCSLLAENHVTFLHFSSHNGHLIRYGLPDPSNIFLDFFVYVQDYADFKNIYNIAKDTFEKVILFVKLGVVVILPKDFIQESGKCRYVLVLSFLFKDEAGGAEGAGANSYSFLSKDSNLLGLSVHTDLGPLPGEDLVRKVPTFRDSDKTLCVHSTTLKMLSQYKFEHVQHPHPRGAESLLPAEEESVLSSYLKAPTFE
jgi:hypothetical protein